MSRILQRPVFSVDGWSANTVDGDGVEWWITKEDGWSGAPDMRVELTGRPRRDGAFDAPGYSDLRVITLEGVAIATGRTAREHAKHRLAALLRDGSRLHPLLVAEDTVTRQAMVRLTAEVKIVDTTPSTFEWSVQLTAPDPRKYGASQREDSCGLPRSGTGPAFPWTFPLAFSDPSGGRMTLVNAGTAPAYPRWRVEGPCEQPMVRHIGTGERLAFDLRLATGEFLAIDTDARRVLLQGSVSRRHLMLPDSRWFELSPGGNEIGFTAWAYEENARLFAYWRNAWF